MMLEFSGLMWEVWQRFCMRLRLGWAEVLSKVCSLTPTAKPGNLAFLGSFHIVSTAASSG